MNELYTYAIENQIPYNELATFVYSLKTVYPDEQVGTTIITKTPCGKKLVTLYKSSK